MPRSRPPQSPPGTPAKAQLPAGTEALKGKVDIMTKGLEKIYKALGIVDSKAIKGQDEDDENKPAKKDFGSRDSWGRKITKSE